MLKIILMCTFLISYSVLGQQSNRKSILIDNFVLPKTLVDWNYQYVRHGMDVIFSDNQNEIVLGKLKKRLNTFKLFLIIIKSEDGYKGQVRLTDTNNKNIVALVPLSFKNEEESVDEVRMAITEAILGKKYVVDHLLEIKAKAKVRFKKPKESSINEVIIADEDTQLDDKPEEIAEKKAKKNKKEIKKKNEKKELKLSQLNNNKDLNKSKLQTQIRSEVTAPHVESAKVEQVEIKPIDIPKKTKEEKVENEEIKIPKNLYFYAFVYAGQLEITTVKNVKVITTINHAGLGASAKIIESGVKYPNEYSMELQIARPLNRDGYSIPMWRKLNFYYLKKNFFDMLNLGTGVEFEPLYFISLPVVGEGLTVIDNNIFWANLMMELKNPQRGEDHKFAFILSKSIITSSSTDVKLTGVKINAMIHNKIYRDFSFDLIFQKSFLTDSENEASNQMLSGFLRYKF